MKGFGILNNGADNKYSNDEYTPRVLHWPIGPFDFDPCAGHNTKIGTIANWTKDDNGLFGMQWPKEWFGFVNPPFSDPDKKIGDSEWKILIAEICRRHGNNILLLPLGGVASWQEFLFKNSDGMFLLHKRQRFENAYGLPRKCANFSTALFPFGNLAVERIKKSGLDGSFFKVMN